MRRFASLVAVLILLSTAAPLLACVSKSAMSQPESACCRTMHGKCDGMAKMGCCRTEGQSSEHPQLAISAPVISFNFVALDWFVRFLAGRQIETHSPQSIPSSHAPPGLLIARSTVLRI